MKTKVSIKNMVSASVSRARGYEAFQNLASYLSFGGDVEISFEGQDIVSVSFMDELVLRLVEANHLHHVVFVVSTQDLVQKLAKVAAIRDAEIFIRSKAGQEKILVAPKQAPEIVIQRNKAQASNTR